MLKGAAQRFYSSLRALRIIGWDFCARGVEVRQDCLKGSTNLTGVLGALRFGDRVCNLEARKRFGDRVCNLEARNIMLEGFRSI